MFELLDRLRSKPEHYRKTVAIVMVSIITGVIFLVWAVGSLSRLSQASLDTEVEEFPSTIIESASAFSSLKDQLGDILEDSAGIVDSIRDPIEYNNNEPELEPK